MTLGAAAAGARAATGSCGQGIALMQEAIAEAALNETPFVVFNMARNQQDYFQATRGGGWGDYRTITLAPQDIPEAVEHTQLAFHLADKHRAPVMLYGDPLIAQTRVGGRHPDRATSARCRPRTGRWTAPAAAPAAVAQIWTWAMGKANDARARARTGTGGRSPTKFDAHRAREEQRHEQAMVDDAETVVVAFGTAGEVRRATSSTSCAPRATASAGSAPSPCGRSPAPRWRRPPPARRSGCSSSSSTPAR